MKVLVAVNEFKGSLSSLEIGEIISDKLNSNYDNITTLIQPIADGGDGFLALFKGFEKMKFKTINAARQECEVNYLLDTKRKEAVIEIAEVIGLKHLKDIQRDPYKTSTVGLGRLISFLLKKGINHFIIGLGGSATNDCGIGMLSELGIQFTDKNGNPCKHGMNDLMKINKIDLRFINDKFKNAKFTIISDVNNPLIGKNGATYVYSKQKGLSESKFQEADKYIENFADIVITGEGKLDKQSFMGKAPIEIARLAKKFHKKVIFLAGNILDDEISKLNEDDKKLIDASFSIQRKFISLNTAMDKKISKENLENTIVQIFNILEFNNG